MTQVVDLLKNLPHAEKTIYSKREETTREQFNDLGVKTIHSKKKEEATREQFIPVEVTQEAGVVPRCRRAAIVTPF